MNSSLRARVSQVPLTFVLALSVVLCGAQAAAEGTEGEAKRHFTNGLHLFEDRNFAGALVEFETSYQQNPTAAALQNIAVCQKGLFRYGEAISTLERMLHDFKAQLSADDKKAAEDAIHDMSALLGTIVVKVTPDGARVSVNDELLSPEALKAPVRLAAGEYRLVAEAPGYARQERMLRVVSGQKDLPVMLTLTPLSGTLVIRTHDSQAAIAIDGKQVGYDEWKGPVFAGPHEIYVYTQAQRHKSQVVAYAGQVTELDAKLLTEDAIPASELAAQNGGAASTPAAGTAATAPAGPPTYVPPSQRGIYAFLGLGGASLASQGPAGVKPQKNRASGPAGGVTLGYRFSTLFGAELHAESATHQVATCASGSGSDCPAGPDYRLEVSRLGAGVRFMTGGHGGRAVGSASLGVVGHTLTLDGKDSTGAGAYLAVSAGYELSLSHFLLGAGCTFTGESNDSNGIKSTGSVGLEVRLGYAQW